MLTTKQVCDELNISTKTIKKLIEAGEITAIRVGDRYRITQAELDEFIRRKTTQRIQ